MSKVEHFKEQLDTEHESFKRMDVFFGPEKHNHRHAKNSVRTSKYTWASWAPLSLLYQFTRAANIYFLIISILTCMPFSPKQPASMIGTFAMVLVFTMFKELFEDYYRMKSDRQINNTVSKILNYETGEFEDTKWKDIKTGDIVKVEKDHSFPADILFFYAKSDVIFVDTMNLDGETNLKPKVMASKDMAASVAQGNAREESKEDTHLPPIDKAKLLKLSGCISCELPNENLEQWDANLILDHDNKQPSSLKIGNLLLRG